MKKHIKIHVIASKAKQSPFVKQFARLLRRYAPRNDAKSICFILLLVFFNCNFFIISSNEKAQAQQTCQSISSNLDVTGPTFNYNYSGMPDLPNTSFSTTQAIRMRIGGCQTIMGACASLTTWNVTAAIAGLDNPVQSTSSNIQYSDILLNNITLTNVGGLPGTATLQAPYSSGMATLADIISSPTMLVGSGATHASNMCANAMNGVGATYWQLSADYAFTHDFYFNIASFAPSLIYTITCTGNCF